MTEPKKLSLLFKSGHTETLKYGNCDIKEVLEGISEGMRTGKVIMFSDDVIIDASDLSAVQVLK